MTYTLGEYDTFRCIASACPDTCCIGWDVVIDDDAAARYETMDDALGGKIIFARENGRCPFLCTDGLCAIQREKGERTLPLTCRRFPRILQQYADFTESCLSISCPEAARLYLRAQTLRFPDPVTADTALAQLIALRRQWTNILQNRTVPFPERLCAVLCDAMQQSGYTSQEPGSETPDELFRFLHTLDLMTEDFARLTTSCLTARNADWTVLENLSVCVLYRYLLQAVSDGDILLRVQQMLACVTFAAFANCDAADAARLFCKEVEHSYENLDAVYDACYTHPAFAPETFLRIWGDRYESA